MKQSFFTIAAFLVIPAAIAKTLPAGEHKISAPQQYLAHMPSVQSSVKMQKPVCFMENNGQVQDQHHHVRSDVQFSVAAGNGLNIFIGDGAVHYQFSKSLSNTAAALTDKYAMKENTYSAYRMDVELVGANKHAVVETGDGQGYYERYISATTGTNGAVSHTFNKITYKDVYPHIDWVLYVSQGRLKQEFIVRNGGKTTDIKLKYSGAGKLKINADGSLAATTPMGTITEQAPMSYDADGREVSSAFKLNGDLLTYKTAAYSGTLTIDPTLEWSTYFGGTNNASFVMNMAVDNAGNLFAAGTTDASSGLATTGAFQTTFVSTEDAFVAKITPDGHPVWATYFGGSGRTDCYSVTVDNLGHLYIAGYTNCTSGIASSGAQQTTYGGGLFDAFLAKFDTSGARQWSTYFGGSDYDLGGVVKTDAAGNVYLSGFSQSTSGIATSGAYQSANAGGQDVYLAKYSSAGALQWATYYGGTGNESCIGLAFDAGNNIFLTGVTTSTSGIAAGTVYQATNGGNKDVFLAKFNNAGVLQWGTYYGGSANDLPQGLTMDGAGDLYIAGYTNSSSAIATPGAYQQTYGGASDAFLAKFDNTGNIKWATYYGGLYQDQANAIAIDGASHIYLVGPTQSSSGIATPGALNATYIGGSNDAYLAEFDTSGNLQYGSYFGGSSFDIGQAVAADNANNVYVGGYTTSTDVATSGSYISTYPGYEGGFMAKFHFCTPPVITAGRDTAICAGSSAPLSVAGGDSYVWTPAAGLSATTGAAVAATPTVTTVYTVTGTNISGCSSSAVVTVTVNTAPVIDPVSDISRCSKTMTSVSFSSNIPGTTYAWANNNTTIGLAASGMGAIGTFSLTNTTTADKTATVVVTPSVNGCTGIPDTFHITAKVVPTINGPIASQTVCAGATTALYHFSGPVSGTQFNWTNSNSAIGIPSSGTGDILPFTATNPGSTNISGIVDVTPSLNGCTGSGTAYLYAVKATPAPTLSINTPAPICAGTTATLTVAGGTTYSWAPATGLSGTTGPAVTAGPASTITYTVTETACNVKGVVTVSVSPTPVVNTVSGQSVCNGASTMAISFSSSPSGAGFGWSNSNTSIGLAASGSGDIAPFIIINTGSASTVATVTVTPTLNTCTGASKTFTITANPSVGPISGDPTVCVGSTTAFANTATGTWSSSNPIVASVNTVSGMVGGNTQGVATITFNAACGSAEKTVTVNAIPALVTNNILLCTGGATNTLSDASTGGTWSSDAPGIAAINTTTGQIVTGSTPGVVHFTYSNGCGSSATVSTTVNTVPAMIAGNTPLCSGGAMLTLSDEALNGTWSSNNTSVASAVATTGVVQSGTQGTAIITYDNGCGIASATVVVNAPPATISNNIILCTGGITNLLGNSSTGGTWSSSAAAIATVDMSTGMVTTGSTQGIVTFTYSNGCGSAAYATTTVNATPGPITGNVPLCTGGSSITLHNTAANGTWSSSAPGVAAVNSSTGVVNSGMPGTTTISYANGCGSAAVATATVLAGPVAHTFTGGGGYCTGDAGVPVGLTLSDTGISYQLYLGGTPVGTAVAGTGYAIDFGVYSDTGIYHAIATNVHTSCTSYFSGVTVHLNPLPDVFNTTGGGSYCANGSGMSVGLDGSATGINYQLYNGTSPVGSPMPGTGAGFDFGPQTAAGPYSVIATNITTGCSQIMNDTVAVTIIPLPTDYAMTAVNGGNYCTGDTGVHVGLVNSDAGIQYQLCYNGGPVGSAVTSPGGALDFGLQTNGGTYSVIATNPVTTCVVAMTASVTVTPEPLPLVYDVTAVNGGNYCSADTGVHIGLSNSESGVSYQLYIGTSPAGSSVNGTGSAIDFGLFTTAGTYKVIGTNSTTGCVNAMNDSAVVTITTTVHPSVTLSTGIGTGDTVCTGALITFTGQTTNGGPGADYTWFVNGANVSSGVVDSTYTYSPVAGDIIRVVMTSSAACAAPPTVHDTMLIHTEDPLPPSVFIFVRSSTAINAGQPDTLVAVPTNCGSSPQFQWYRNSTAIAGATSAIYISSSFANGDSVSCQVITSGPCGGQLTYNSAIISIIPAGVVQVSGNTGDIRLIPNPNKGSFAVKGSLSSTTDETVNMEITDMLGQVICRARANTSNGQIDERIQLPTGVANGMYILSLQSRSEHKVFHFVIEQ